MSQPVGLPVLDIVYIYIESHNVFSFVTGLFHLSMFLKADPSCSVYKSFIRFHD